MTDAIAMIAYPTRSLCDVRVATAIAVAFAGPKVLRQLALAMLRMEIRIIAGS